MAFRTSLKMVAAMVLAFCAAFPVMAGICPECGSRSHTKDIGSCKLCDGMTMSGEFQLCMDCSDRLQECEQCRKALLPAAPRIDEKAYGIHRFGRWVYEYTRSNEGSKSEGYFGKLSFSGQSLPEPAEVNAHVRTPWGLMYWAGNPTVAFGSHGWMLRPRPGQPLGRLIQPAAAVVVQVKVLAADRGAPPEEAWIRQEMKAMQIPEGVGSGSQWITLGKDPVTIHDSKHFGQVYLAVVDPGGGAPLRLEISGSRSATVEIPRKPGTHRIVPHTTASSIASLDFYFAVAVESRSPKGEPR